jgi:adenylylsulfate kinase
VRKNYGITSLIVGRDHAGVGSFYGRFEAQQMFDRFAPGELGVTPLKFDATFFCRACDMLASERTCPHTAAERVELSGSRVREILRSGGHLPVEFTRPEVAEVLRAHYLADGNGRLRDQEPGPPPAPASVPAPSAAAPAPDAERGFIVWFTGLSGAGKSTLANYIRPQLAATRRVEILDGDDVRTYLSKGLGFSKEDRDANIRRIGYVARLLARNGVAVITAAISPYAEIRDEVRELAARDGIPFIEVFAHAEIDALADRDVKGLYKKAIAGEIAHFTGISDPYEAPVNAEVVVRSDKEPIEESANRIIAALRARKLIS